MGTPDPAAALDAAATLDYGARLARDHIAPSRFPDEPALVEGRIRGESLLTVSKSRISRRLVVLFMPVALILGTVAAPIARGATGLVVVDLNHGATASGLAQTLAGDGVTVSNVTFRGTNNAAGTFTGGTGIIGFESGVILGTGSVQTLPTTTGFCGPPGKGVEGPNECPDDTTVNNTAGDADLTALAGSATHDAAVLEFDFVPQNSSVQFRYVFSSNEYTEFVNSEFNDTFGFFVNGVNCALVPGTSLPVSINTINGGRPLGTNPQHPQFYRDNSAAPSINAEPDGFTTVLTCDAAVNAGVANHLKLAIADGSDAILDSDVFLEAGSIVSPPDTLTALGDAHLWLGLRNSDDQGTQFDVKVELFRNAETRPLASGLTRCVVSLTRSPALARNVTVHWDPFSPVSLAANDQLYIKISTRIGTTGTGANPNKKCPGPGGSHNNAVALRFDYGAASRNSSFGATIGAASSNLYFHSDGGACDKPVATVDSQHVTTRFLDSNTSTGTLVRCKDSGKLNFNGGNPYTEVGRWKLP